MRFKSRSRALAASALAASLGLSGLALTASPVNAEPAEIIRVAGATRYGTAAAAADRAYPDGSTNVVLASGEDFPDALSAGGFAGSLDAPILLTPQAELDDATLSGLESLGAENVYVMGGTAAVSETVVDALEAEGYTVERVAGDDRFETAAATAAEIGGTTRVLANGFSFADALAISPGAHALELPIVLTNTDDLPAASEAALEDATTVVIVGGTAVVSQAIEDGLEADGKTVVRLAGQNRYESAVEIAEFHFDNGFEDDELVMATGENFADALAGGPLASQLNAPLVLTQTNVLTPATETFIESIAPALDTLYILGGTAAITDAVAEAAAAAADEDAGLPGNQDFPVTPGATTMAAFDPVTDNGAIVPVTFSGLDPAIDYDVALVPCTDYDGPSVMSDGSNLLDENGVSLTDGTITFSDQNFDDIADDIGTTPYGYADILTVNFDNVGGDYGDDLSPDSAGEFLVRVQAQGGNDCVFVVAFADNADDDELDLAGSAVVENDNTPTDEFAISGAITWDAGEAPTGYDMEEDVLFLNKAQNYWIDGEGYRINYGDAGDQYWYEGAEVDQLIPFADWEDALSLGDDTSDDKAAYTRTGNNIFEIEGDYVTGLPSAPTVSVANSDGDATANDVTFTWTDPNPGADIDEYNVEIYNATTGAFVVSVSTDEVNTVGGGDAEKTVTYDDLADGTYVARVQADSETDSGYFDFGPFSASFAVGAPADTTAPIILDATVAAPPSVTPADGGLVGVLDNGDWHRFVFNEPMAASIAADGSTYRVVDGDGTIVDIVCGGDAAPATDGCFLNPTAGTDPESGFEFEAGQIMYVRIGAGGATATIASPGTTVGAQYPVTVTNVSSGWDDAAGNQLNLVGSVDKTIESS